MISDQHAGLVKALKRCFQGAGHQRCRVHFARNLLAHVPKDKADMVASMFRMIFSAPDAEAVHATWEEVRDRARNDRAAVSRFATRCWARPAAMSASLRYRPRCDLPVDIPALGAGGDWPAPARPATGY